MVVFLEDDDLFERTKLKVIYDIFKQNQNLGFYRHKVKIINENGKEANLPYNLYNSGKIVIKKSRNIGKQYLLTYKNRGGYASVSSMAIRREILEEYDTYLKQIKLAIDSFYLVIGFLSNYDMLFDDIVLGKYRLQKYFASSNLTN